MEFSHDAWLHAHRNTREGLGDRQLDHRGLLAVTAVDDAPFGFFQFELEGWQLLPRSYGIRNIILKAIVAPSELMGMLEENMKTSC